jgi:type IV secretory pathway VirB4 component
MKLGRKAPRVLGPPLVERYPAPARGGGVRSSILRRVRGERPAHVATTAHLQSVYPFMAEGGLGGRGVFIGKDMYGGSFTYDPWELYELGVITSPNMVVLGQLGKAKSSLVKTMLLRQYIFGRRAWVLDPKGEYAPLAHALGVEPIKLTPGGDVRLNPLTRRGGEQAQQAILSAVAAAALGRELEPEENAGLREALRVLNESAPEPTLPEIVKLLLRPRPEMAENLATTPEELAAAARSAALAVQRLCEGDLRGMFDGPTTIDLGLDSPLVVIDLSEMLDAAGLGILMTCAAAWQRAQIAHLRAEAEASGGVGPKIINVLDEGWRFFSHLGAARWLQESFKLARQHGLQNVIVMHRLSDLQAAGTRDSQEVKIAEGLVSDTETRVIYGQPRDQVPLLRDILALSETELEIVPQLQRGVALWQVGRRSYLVHHRISAYEREIVDTDARMRSVPRSLEGVL